VLGLHDFDVVFIESEAQGVKIFRGVDESSRKGDVEIGDEVIDVDK
jgi:hypothetical protein